MKEAELRKHANCSLCGNKVGATGLPLFWRVTVERFGIDMRAAQRQTGLAMMLGHAGLAQMMGPDEDMAKPMMHAAVLTVCENCCTESTCVASLAQIATEATERRLSADRQPELIGIDLASGPDQSVTSCPHGTPHRYPCEKCGL